MEIGNVTSKQVRLLVIDDDPGVLKDLLDIMSREKKFSKFLVKAAQGPGEQLIKNAKHLARDFRPHVAIVDLRLFANNLNDTSGLELLKHLHSARCILYSAYLNHELTRDISMEYPNTTWVEKAGSPQMLLDVVQEKAREVCAAERKVDILKPAGFFDKAVRGLLGNDASVSISLIDDILVQLFPSSKRISLEPLDQSIVTVQSISRGRSIVMKVVHDDRLEPHIVKIAPSDAISREVNNYRKFIRGNLHGHFYASLEENSVLFWDLGALLYTLVDQPEKNLISFREFYEKHSEPKAIVAPLRHLYTSSWKQLYRDAQKSRQGLDSFYNKSFHLRKRLLKFSNKNEKLVFPDVIPALPNPARWLMKHAEKSRMMPFLQAITHGDLHADNLFVNDKYAWAIDFERSGKGHILRDFIEMEVDIFTRLSVADGNPSANNEQLLIAGLLLVDKLYPLSNENLFGRLTDRALKKAVEVIDEQRKVCFDVTRLSDFREYLWGLLFDTVFLSTLVEEDRPQYQRSLLLGAIVCERLKKGSDGDWLADFDLPALSKRKSTKYKKRSVTAKPQPDAASHMKGVPGKTRRRNPVSASTQRLLRVFISYASADKAMAKELYKFLAAHQVDVWLDSERLLPGQKWQEEIPKAILDSDAIIVMLSGNSIDKKGYVQKEIRLAMDKALEMPENEIFMIPARLENCDVPPNLREYQWVDLFLRGGYKRLLESLQTHSQADQSLLEINPSNILRSRTRKR